MALAILLPVSGLADIDFDANGKHYRLVTTAATWAAARTAAFASTYNGNPGHLATIESAAENAAIFARIDPSRNADVEAAIPWASYRHPDSFARSVWLGTSDDASSVAGASEGNFYWVGESPTAATTHFWQGGQGGSAVAGRYTNWGNAGVEPDNWLAIQDHAGMQLDGWPYGAAGEWNDLDGTVAQAYLIEYEEVQVPELQAPEVPTGESAVLRWTSYSNQIYTIHHSTNLQDGFSVRRSDVSATPPMNVYTDAVGSVRSKFWKVSVQK